MDLAAWTRRLPHAVPPTAGRVLLVDGDGLAYTQSGPAGTSREQARSNVINKVAAFRRRTGASEVKVLLTAPGSPKGGRYAVATVKPYQGQRKSGRRPENWEYLRGLLESESFDFPIQTTTNAEADDLFALYSHKLGHENVAIATQDKDMRMVPGLHVTWDDMHLVQLAPGEDFVAWDLQYGLRWFWLQMLMGDSADNIPGLPRLNGKLCGEVGAINWLAGCPAEHQLGNVLEGYRTHYGEDADLHMIEQGILLWMRRKPVDVFDVCNPEYGPLAPLLTPAIRATIEERLCAASHAPN